MRAIFLVRPGYLRSENPCDWLFEPDEVSIGIDAFRVDLVTFHQIHHLIRSETY